MKQMTHVVVSEGSFASADKYDLINSNLTVVNLLQSEGYPSAWITPESRAAYWVDFYRAQMANGGFPQFVYNARWSAEVVAEVQAGLEALAVPGHAALFATQKAVVDTLTSDELATFLASSLFGTNPIRDRLATTSYAEVETREPLYETTHAYLRGLKNLKVLSIDDMFTALEDVLGRPIAR